MRPLPLSELFDEVFRIYRRRFWLVFVTSLFGAIPTILFFLVDVAVRSVLQDSGSGSGLGIAGAVAALIGLALLPFSLYAVWRACAAAVLGEPATVGSILQGVGRRYWRLWLLALGYGFLILTAAVLCITCFLIPLGLWLLVKWSVVVPAWLLEQPRLGSALSRSWDLTRDNWWRLFGILLLFIVLYFAISYALLTFVFFVALVPQEWVLLVTGVVLVTYVGFTTFLGPLFPMLLTLLYFDLRVRHEHLDLEMAAREVGGRGRPWELPTPPRLGADYS